MAAHIDADRLLPIKISDSDRLEADRAVLSAFSSCARDLPDAAAEWDVSGLVLEGQQVQRSTVVAWLNLSYKSIHGAPYEDTPWADSLQSFVRSFTSLAQLLAFADAVGSSRGLLLALDKEAAPLAADVQLGERPVQLKSNESYFHHKGLRHLEFYPPYENHQRSISAGSDGEVEAAVQQLAQQVEPLLYLAYKLELENIQERVRAFIFNNSYSCASVLHGKALLETVLSERVLATKAGAAASKQALASALSTLPVSLSDPDYCNLDGLLKPLALTSEQRAVKFTAECQRDFMAFTKGQQVEVTFNPLRSPYITVKALPVSAEEEYWGDEAPLVSRDLHCHLLLGDFFLSRS